MAQIPERGRSFAIVFYILLVIQTLPIWLFSNFPSQDGPSHIYNAAILSHYDKVPVYQQFYTTHISPAGNVLTQLLLCLFLPLGPVAAGKLFLILYALLLPLSFRALVRTAGGEPGPLVLFGFLLVPNFFLYFGFWNFCLSIPLMFLSLAYARSHRERWTAGSAIVFGVLSFLTYSAHLISWGALAMTVAAAAVASVIGARGSQRLMSAVRQVLPGLIAVSVPALPAFLYLRSNRNGMHFESSVWKQAWPLYSASFMRGLAPAGRLLSLGFVLVVMCLAAYAVVQWRSHRPAGDSVIFVVCAGFCALACLFGPSGAAEGAYVNDRMALYAWVFAVLWLACSRWTGVMRAITAAAFGILVLAGLALNLRAGAAWDRELREYAGARRLITPGSTVLPITIETQAPSADPMFHAVDLLTVVGAIDLRNYEACLPYFSVQFRPGIAPPCTMEKTLPISMYENATGRRVDFVAVYGGVGRPELQSEPGLANYKTVYISQPGARVRLYQRRY